MKDGMVNIINMLWIDSSTLPRYFT